MNFKRFALFTLLIAASSTAVQAKEDVARFKVGITAGTLGVGPEVSYRLSEHIGIRGNVTLLSVSGDINSDGITYESKIKLQSGGVMLDAYPLGGGFRVSGGLRVNGNKASGLASPNSDTSYTINGTTYSAADIGNLRAETDIKNLAPALTLGYGGGLSNGLVFGIEAGALFQGSVKIKPLTLTGACAGSSPPATCATVVADLDAERRSVNDDIDRYKVYPVLQLSVGYRF